MRKREEERVRERQTGRKTERNGEEGEKERRERVRSMRGEGEMRIEKDIKKGGGERNKR